MSSNYMNATELRSYSEEELSTFLRDKCDELLKLKFQFATGQLEDITRLKFVKREIARAKTIAVEQAGSASAQG